MKESNGQHLLELIEMYYAPELSLAVRSHEYVKTIETYTAHGRAPTKIVFKDGLLVNVTADDDLCVVVEDDEEIKTSVHDSSDDAGREERSDGCPVHSSIRLESE